MIVMLGKIKAFLQNHKNKILAAVSFITAGYFIYKYYDDEPISISEFINKATAGKVSDAIFDGNILYFLSQNRDWSHTLVGNYQLQEVYELLISKGISFSSSQKLISNETLALGATCLFSVGAFKYMMSQINKPSISTVEYKPNFYSTGNSFDDYYGGEQIKEKFREVIDFLHSPEKYEAMGARIRRGVLFYGPPGTGKTMLARSLANEAGCSFIKVVASEFQEIFVGVGPKRIRELFQSARKCPNGCIIFIDEIDALGSRLNHLRDSHETTTTINQFLSQMDGFFPNEKVLIVAATNRIDLVDHAILRAGRFDLKIFIPPPDLEQRKGIFRKILLKKTKELSTVDDDTINYIAKNSENWCGADLETLVNESIYKAIEDHKDFVASQHVLAAFDEIQVKK